jgi:4-hydroxybenzoate polyprenyltransferase
MLSNYILRICDFIFVLRPLILIPAWSFYLIGAHEGSSENSSALVLFPSIKTLSALTAILITAYLLNQIFDREADARNKKCFYINEKIFHVRTILILAILFFIAGSLAFQQVGTIQRGPLVLALFTALFYSLPPIRLCARPFLDLLANAIGYGGIAFVLGYGIFSPSLNTALVLSTPYVLLVGATFLHTAILDVEGDRAAGKTTTAVLIGDRGAAFIALVLNLSAVIVAMMLAELTAVIVCGLSCPFSLYAAIHRKRSASSFLVQANTFIVTLAAVVAWPAYLTIIVPLILLSRFYYRRRFGISYPGPQRIV